MRCGCQMSTTLQAVLSPHDGDGEAVSFLPGRGDVLNYLEEQVVSVVWRDRNCGNEVCEEPHEFPAMGEVGCAADCGRQAVDATLLLYIQTNFTLPGRSAQELLDRVRWNLCRREPGRAQLGLPDICWFVEAQRFRTVWGSTVEQYDVPAGDWCVTAASLYIRPHQHIRMPCWHFTAVIKTAQEVMCLNLPRCPCQVYSHHGRRLWGGRRSCL